MLAEDLLASRERAARATAALDGERLMGPMLAIVNPPLWELGHVGWFQERWCLREQPGGAMTESILPNADALYDSSAVAHDSRWSLPLPSLGETRKYLQNVLDAVLGRLQREPEDESLRYFVRLATFHEDMHTEAFHYTHQTLGYPDPLAGDKGPFPRRFREADVEIPAGNFTLGAVRERSDFVFDNEKWSHEVQLAPFAISPSVVTNAQYLQFVQAGGKPPRYWKKIDGVWVERRFDEWRPLDLEEPVRHVDWNEAQAWCRWAKRRLPTEAEWERACMEKSFGWGAVWEWTASTFDPYPGFSADPYRDYSMPWFGTHKVLRGASFTTPRRLARPGFRNFYTADRADIFAGFRTCKIDS
jgi:iron(II)-dependent oxidoreductase